MSKFTDCAKKDKELSKLRRQLEEKEKQIIELETSYRIEYCEHVDGACVKLGEARKQIAEKDKEIAALRAQQEQSAPVVRCKDCKYHDLGQEPRRCESLGYCILMGAMTPNEGFCYLAQRRR